MSDVPIRESRRGEESLEGQKDPGLDGHEFIQLCLILPNERGEGENTPPNGECGRDAGLLVHIHSGRIHTVIQVYGDPRSPRMDITRKWDGLETKPGFDSMACRLVEVIKDVVLRSQ